MLNYNGKALLSRYMSNSVNFMLKSVDNTEKSCGLNSYANQILFQEDAKIVVGSGSTAPALSDYSIENEINGLSLISFAYPNRDSTATYVFGENDVLLSATATFKNETASDIEVKEIAFYGFWSSSNWGDNKYYMIAREVLETPVIIEPNKTYAFSITVS